MRKGGVSKKSCPKSYLTPLLLAVLLSGVIIHPAFGSPNAEQAQSSDCKGVEPYAVNADVQDRDNFNSPENAIDGNIDTIWHSHSKGDSIEFDLGEKQAICYLDIAWHLGDKRINNFKISYANQNRSMDDYIIWGTLNSSGALSSFERYRMDDMVARYVKITIDGNQWNDLAGIIEVNVYAYPPDYLNESKFFIGVMRATIDDQSGLVDLYRHYGNQHSIFLSKPDDSNLEYTMQLAGKHGVSYFSVEDIEANAAQLKSRGTDVIEYNIEESYSPATDLQDPVSAVKKAYSIAHSNGLKLILTPSVQLTAKYDSEFARYTDYYNIMAMSLQNDGCWTEFRNFVRNTTSSVSEINPNALISVELSTVRGSLSNMKECYSASAEFVDGLNVWYSNDEDGFSKMRLFLDWFDSHCRHSPDDISFNKFLTQAMWNQKCRLAWLS